MPSLNKKSILLIIVSILVVFILFLQRKTENITTINKLNTYSNIFFMKERSILEEKLKNEKLTLVYDYIKYNYMNEQVNTVHNLLHWFGGKIYEKEGIKGIAICDDAFKWGCFHGFFGKAFSDKGIKLLYEAQKECLKHNNNSVLNNGCLHGIGHGIMVMEGYDLNGLNSSLKDCELLIDNFQVMTCAGGVFMEYNDGLLSPQKDPDQLTSLRLFQKDDPYMPCSEAESKFQPICYKKWSIWLWQVFDGNIQTLIPLCKKVINKINRNSCFSGLGEVAMGFRDADVSNLIKFCNNLIDPDGIKSCLKSIVHEMNLRKDPNITQICQKLGMDNIDNCIQDSYEFN